MISSIILTCNEAEDLPACLAALSWCDDIHVVDSGSQDNTQALARQHGAKVWERAFDSFARQRNWALEACALKHPWVLFLDADEVATPGFAAALRQQVAAADEDVAGFYCCWKMMFMGRWLKRCDSFPKWQFRVVRRGRGQFMDFGHGQKEAEVQGRIEYLREPYVHNAFSKGLNQWLARHARYADREAAVRLNTPLVWRRLFDRHASVRHAALKVALTRLPGWPLWRVVWPYLFRLGFLEGWPGWVYCVLLGYYEFLIKVKMKELQSRRQCT